MPKIQFANPPRTLVTKELLTRPATCRIWVQIGQHPTARARFDTRQIATDRISSVQYLKSPVGVEVLRSIGDGVRVFSDHPRYQASTTLTASQVMALAEDVS